VDLWALGREAVVIILDTHEKGQTKSFAKYVEKVLSRDQGRHLHKPNNWRLG